MSAVDAASPRPSAATARCRSAACSTTRRSRRCGAGSSATAPSRARSPRATGPTATFFEDFCNWERIAEYEDVIRGAELGRVAAELMGSGGVRLFHDHLLVKEAGSTEPSPWHQDQPYYCVDGRQNVSFWIPVDPVARENTLEFVAGSQAPGHLVHAAHVHLADRARLRRGRAGERPGHRCRPVGSRHPRVGARARRRRRLPHAHPAPGGRLADAAPGVLGARARRRRHLRPAPAPDQPAVPGPRLGARRRRPVRRAALPGALRRRGRAGRERAARGARSHRHRALVPRLAAGGGAADADEQPRPGRRRAPRRPRRLRRHRAGGSLLGRLRRDRPRAARARRRRDPARAVGQAGRRLPHPRVVAAGADRELEPGRRVGELGRVPPPRGARADDVRADDRRLLDLHRQPGDRPGHLRVLRRDRPAAVRRHASPGRSRSRPASAAWAARSRSR